MYICPFVAIHMCECRYQGNQKMSELVPGRLMCMLGTLQA